jgi:hypothetical protein
VPLREAQEAGVGTAGEVVTALVEVVVVIVVVIVVVVRLVLELLIVVVDVLATVVALEDELGVAGDTDEEAVAELVCRVVAFAVLGRVLGAVLDDELWLDGDGRRYAALTPLIGSRTVVPSCVHSRQLPLFV